MMKNFLYLYHLLIIIISIYFYNAYVEFCTSLVFLSLVLFFFRSRSYRSLIISTFIAGFSSFCTSIFFLDNFSDYVQLEGDIAHYIDFAYYTNYNFSELTIFTNAPLAVLIWKNSSNLLGFLGFKYIYFAGIVVNIILFSLSTVIVSKVFKFNEIKNRTFSILILLPNMLWLFAGAHVRDVFLVFVMAVQVYLLFRFEDTKKVLFILVFILLIPLFVILRYQFVVFPFMAYGLFFFTGLNSNKRIVFIIVFLSTFSLLYEYFDSLVGFVDTGQKYFEKSEENSGDGLGISVIKAPTIIKLFLGPLYLIVFPFPFWNSLFLGTFYHFTKGLSVVFSAFYFYIVIFATYKNRLLLKDRLFFFTSLLLLVFLTATTFSSMESRHIAVFQLFLMGNYIISSDELRTTMLPLKFVYVSFYLVFFLIYVLLKYSYG